MKEKDKIEEAQKIINEAEQKRMQEFNKELSVLLEKYGYILDVAWQIILKKK